MNEEPENEEPEVEITHSPKFTRLAALISVFGINRTIWQAVDEYFAAEDGGKLISLGEIVSGWNLRQRAWDVLELRAGFVKRHSYEEIGEQIGGVGRARVQQILKKTLQRLEKRVCCVVPLLTLLEGQVSSLWSSDESASSINFAVCVSQNALPEIGWEPLQGGDVRRLLLALRALVNADMHAIPNSLPQLSYLACSLPPELVKHPQVAARIAAEVAEDAARNPRWTYELLVETVLEEAGMPLHYKEIADRADEMGVRSDLSLKGVNNVLFAKPDKFAYVGQGTYGLKAWGMASVDSYVNIIVEALKASGQVMTLNEVSFYVNNKRAIKPHSLQLTLDMNVRFYRTAAKTYGLRSWLSPPEKQTLRTPVWLVEAPASYERVEKALERGYNVEAQVSSDEE